MARLSQTARAMGNLLRDGSPAGSVLAQIARGLLGGSLLAATIVTFVRCGDSSLTSTDFEAGDSGGGNPDSAAVTEPPETGSKDAADLPRVLVVAHASPDAFDFRLCFGMSDTADGANAEVLPLAPLPDDPKSPMPQANYPGIGRGNGAVVDPDFGAVTSSFVVPYLVNALSLATRAPETCKALFACSGTTCIKSPQDFVKLPAIPTSAFTGGGTRLLAVVGSGSALEMKSIALDGNTGPALAGQFAQLSPALGEVSARFGSLDGGADTGVSLGSASFGAVGSPAVVSIKAPEMAAFGSTGITIASADGGALLSSSLAEIQQASDPSRPPDEFYKNKTSYVFVLVGDPSVPKTSPDFGARGLHVVALRSSSLPVDGGTL